MHRNVSIFVRFYFPREVPPINLLIKKFAHSLIIHFTGRNMSTLVIRGISPGIKMETELSTVMRVTPLVFFFLQKECMEKCGVKTTMPGKLADEENDPHHHHHHHPSVSPEEVS